MSAYEYTPITGPQEIRLLILFPGSRSKVIKVGLEHVNSTKHSQFEALSYVWGDNKETSNIRVQRRRRKPSSSSLSSSIPTNTAAWSFEKEVTDTFNSQDWEDAGNVSITKNLAIVLDRLRYEDKPRILWVDALCINQENLDDKSEQVKRMGSNYENAQRTIVWLGPDANEVDENGDFDTELISNIQIAFDTFRKSNERALKDGQQVTDDQTTSWERRVQSPTQLMKTILEPDGKYHSDKVARFVKENDAIRALLKRPWWNRIWIVQETSKSKEIVVYFGELTINWKTLCGGAEKYLVLHGRQVALPERYIYQIRALFEAQRLRASHPNGKNLLSLLLRYRWFEATNPRDKIYGILGLAEKGLDPGIPKVEPNYKTETSICYRDVALEIMRASENLDILQLCPRPVCLPIPNPRTDHAKPLKLPSWVPDFSYDVKQVPEHTVVQDMGPITLHARLESTEGSRLTASGNSQCCAELRPDGVTLTLQGFIFDTIEDQTDKFHSVKINTDDKFGFDLEASRYLVRCDDADEETSIRTLTSNMFQVFYKAGQTSQEQNAQLVMLAKWKRFALSLGQYPTREDLEPIFYRTMVKGDLGANREQGMTELVKAWKHTMKRIQGLGRIPGIIGGLASAISSANTSSTFPVGYIYNQRLAKTSKGYLALVPYDTEIGDKVVLLAGGKSPYVVRNSGDGGWKLVGDCYVEGLMQSEQWQAELCTGLNLV
ncbi:heterokaryon incompatibility protein-domain-containing protein [Xylaria sp. FL1777]|nr:heterokaryon incompatibility protein-domain-containing protein [Xylaria sp. FL1777]